MTILQNAYNAYLTKKYEKEINEFKEVTKSVLDEASSKLKKDLYHCTILSDDKRGAAIATKDLTDLIKLEQMINDNPLEIESRLLNNRYIDTLANEYQKLNNLIVEGETVQFDENKHKWDFNDTGIVKDIIDKQFDEAKMNINERLKEIDNQDKLDTKNIVDKIINVYKEYVQERRDEHLELINCEKCENESVLKKLQCEMNYWEKHYNDILNEINGLHTITGTLTINFDHDTKDFKTVSAIVLKNLKKNKVGLFK
ncbi:hypothetical protein ABNX05_10840 [Lysinibacillus sp. M3]|uniref:Uncharacterized protein n=1 Tax=Lysinibacillus zambalensis TaxID=3160866 RepID=A0ABV1MV44_9BACI